MACSILSIVLKQDQISSDAHLDRSTLNVICSDLLRQATFLSYGQLPSDGSKWQLHRALVSTSLLSVFQWRYDLDLLEFENLVQTTSLVENVASFVFVRLSDSSTSEGPLWTRDRSNDSAKAYALDLICCWSLTGNNGWSIFGKHENVWGLCVKEFWEAATAEDVHGMTTNLAKVALLHHCQRLTARGILFFVFQNHGSTGESQSDLARLILTSLIKMFRHPSFSVKILAVRLVWILLSDRNSVSTHDNISRSFWSSLDKPMVDEILQLVLLSSSVKSTCHPLFLSLVDLLNVILQDPQSSNSVLESLNADSVEKLIHHTESVQQDYSGNDEWNADLGLSLDSDTPPANNLSRLDDTVINDEPAVIPSSGLGILIQLSIATMLAHLGYSGNTSPCNEHNVLKVRICTAVNDFFMNQVIASKNDERSNEMLSFDGSKRKLCLQTLLFTSDNQDFVARTFFSAQLLQNNKFKQATEDTFAAQRKLRKMEECCQELEKQNFAYQSRLKGQSIVFEREISRVRRSAGSDSQQLVTIHAAERERAETRAKHLASQVESVESQLQEVLIEAEESQKKVTESKEALDTALNEVSELRRNNQDLSCQISQDEARVKELEGELYSRSATLDSLHKSREELENEIRSRGEIINRSDGTNKMLHDDLEELFADVVNLATVYEAKEQEAAALALKQTQIESIEKDLRREKDRNGEITGTVKKLRDENDKLYAKLEKYRAKLDDERKRRTEESSRRKRNGPVSYINQLHQSSSSGSSKLKVSSQQSSMSSETGKSNGKENDYRSRR